MRPQHFSAEGDLSTDLPTSGKDTPPHPLRIVDVAVAFGYLALLLPGMVHTAYLGILGSWQLVLSVSATVAIGAALLFRRKYPILVLVTVGVLALAKSTLGGLLDAGAIPLALYAVTAYVAAQIVWIAWGGTLVVTVAAFGVAALGDESVENGSMMLIISLTLQLLAGLIGVVVRLRRRVQDALIARTQSAQREKEQRAEIGRITERSSLSREIHDTVGHTLTAIINLSDGAEISFDTNPERAREGLRRINEVARTALGETRNVVGALRGLEGAASRMPQPDVSRIPELLATAEATGYKTTLAINGQSVVDRSIELSLYRIVQEAVTNTIRHSKNASHIGVTISYNFDSVTVQIYDNGEPQEASRPHSEAHAHAHAHGQGLTGINERAVLTGGTSAAGPAPGGGWYVTAFLRVPTAERS